MGEPAAPGAGVLLGVIKEAGESEPGASLETVGLSSEFPVGG